VSLLRHARVKSSGAMPFGLICAMKPVVVPKPDAFAVAKVHGTTIVQSQNNRMASRRARSKAFRCSSSAATIHQFAEFFTPSALLFLFRCRNTEARGPVVTAPRGGGGIINDGQSGGGKLNGSHPQPLDDRALEREKRMQTCCELMSL
jgi:hypothetical protein